MTRRKQEHVLAGFAVGSGEPVTIPLAHTFVTGQTQLSGKTTTLRAIVVRSGRRALAFITKRGEVFEGRRIRPYLPREGDQPIHWRLVETILASALGQRSMKYERYWIVNAAKGAKSLEGVRSNVERLRAKAKGSTAETYELIGEYLDLVLPEMRELNAAHELELEAGLNVMDLADVGAQLQALVIRACLERINQKESEVLTVFPEAWEFAPRGRVTPASGEAIAMARKGAVLGNYLLCDSQDIAGVDTVVRQAASVWILGVQRELNELKRTLAMIPAGIKKPKLADVTSLELGQFYICWGTRAVRTYVQPAWMDATTARDVARGHLSLEDVHVPAAVRVATARPDPATSEPTSSAERQRQAAHAALAALNKPTEEDDMSAEDVKEIKELLGQLVGALKPTPRNRDDDPVPNGDGGEEEDDAGGEQRGPARVTLTERAPELVINVERRELKEDENSARGRVAHLIGQGFFREPTIGNEAYKWWKNRGFNQPSTRIYEALASLVKDGFLIMTDGKKYQQHPNLKVTRHGEKTVTLTINYK